MSSSEKKALFHKKIFRKIKKILYSLWVNSIQVTRVIEKKIQNKLY